MSVYPIIVFSVLTFLALLFVWFYQWSQISKDLGEAERQLQKLQDGLKDVEGAVRDAKATLRATDTPHP